MRYVNLSTITVFLNFLLYILACLSHVGHVVECSKLEKKSSFCFSIKKLLRNSVLIILLSINLTRSILFIGSNVGCILDEWLIPRCVHVVSMFGSILG